MENVLCDWLAEVAKIKGKGQDIFDLHPTLRKTDDRPRVQALFEMIDMEEFSNQLPSCLTCHGDAGDVLCWGCDATIHRNCLPIAARLIRSPWYCPGCTESFIGCKEVTFDRDLMNFLTDSIVPIDPATERRVLQAAKFMKWEDNRLFIKGKNEVWLQIPPPKDRQRIIEYTAEVTGLPGPDRLY